MAFRIGVLASGRGTNLQSIIDACVKGRTAAEVGIVIGDRDSPALERARAAGIDAAYIPRAKDSKPDHECRIATRLQASGVELVCLAGYMRLVGPVLLDAFPQRIINVHPALLPSFPGLDAQRQALDYGVKVSGCTVHFVDGGMDTGPIILQQAVPVHDDDTVESLSARILAAEHRIYPQAIDLIARGLVIVVGRHVKLREGG